MKRIINERFDDESRGEPKGSRRMYFDRQNLVLRAVVSAPRVEYGVAFGFGVECPRLSWKVSAPSGWAPDRYEVTLWREGEPPQSVVRESSDQIFQDWPFAPLRSRERFEVSVRVGHQGEWSPASERTIAETGLLEEKDWTATFVAPATFGGLDDPAPVISTSITLPSAPTSARLYVSARGLYDFWINDNHIGSDILRPGWTAYSTRIQYQTYDVTAELRQGKNELWALLGNGWYRGQLVWPGNRSSYGDRLALLAQLEVACDDGSVLTFATDGSWRATESGILFDDLYDGQTRDLRILDSPTNKPSQGVEVLDQGSVELVAPSAPPVVVTERRGAIALLRTPSGKCVVDFGQNLVGWVELTVNNPVAGSEVTIRHAEVLEDGELGVRPLRSAKATSRYVLAGAKSVTLKPTFTFHGFRYAEIDGVERLGLDDVNALVIGSNLRRTGWFDSSSPELNQLHQNVVWSMRGNFVDVPTDCPQRDERLGWTGDIQVFAPTANFLFDTAGFLSGWLQDLAAEQKPDGGVPNVIPDVLREPDPASAGWGDAATIVPLSLFDAFADAGVLRRQYTSMVAWVEKISRITGSRRIWDQGNQFGDWLDPSAPYDDPGRAQADPAVVATAYFARSVSLVADAAKVLGHDSEAAAYAAMHVEIVAAFNAEFVTGDGTVRSDCQTVYALALCWGLLDSEDKVLHASARLAQLVNGAGYRVSTGFAGTPLILDALEIAGYPDLAMSMLTQDQSPSWLYAVKMGATTIWERWDSMLPDGSINPGSMTSFNHYAYGAVADWMHRSVAGLASLEPGYRRIRVKPNLAGTLTRASARHDSPYGEISVAWTRDGTEFGLDLDLPFGVSAEVWLPGHRRPLEAGSGRSKFGVVLPASLPESLQADFSAKA
jgi:alpha-L-rhamnosidase